MSVMFDKKRRRMPKKNVVCLMGGRFFSFLQIVNQICGCIVNFDMRNY